MLIKKGVFFFKRLWKRILLIFITKLIGAEGARLLREKREATEKVAEFMQPQFNDT
jgi:hypothetical protein